MCRMARAPRLRLRLAAAALALAVQPLGADPYGGGFGGGMGDDLYKPFTACDKGIKCPAGQRPLQKSVSNKATRVHRETCDKAANMLTVMDPADLTSLDPNKRKTGAQRLDPCCEKRSICHQTCGMSLADCADEYKKCYRKVCGADRNCLMQASFAVMMSEPTYMDEKKGDKCAFYNTKQEAQCDCVPEEDFESQMRSRVKDFYQTFQPQKLTKEVDEDFMSETVYKKFSKGDEPTIWYTLLTKYRENLRKQEPSKPKYGSADDYADPLKAETPSRGAGKKKNSKRVEVEVDELIPQDEEADVVEL